MTMPDWDRIDISLNRWNELTEDVREQLDIIRLYHRAPTAQSAHQITSSFEEIKQLLDDIANEIAPKPVTDKTRIKQSR